LGTVAAVRDGVNLRDRSKDHAEFIGLIEHELFERLAPESLVLTRFLYANRHPLRLKTLW
jgi:hypothetical protein